MVYPTETVYGLGADARSAEAVERLLDAKGRDAAKGLSVLVAGADAAEGLCAQPLSDSTRALLERFWPGPLTVVLPAAAGVAAPLVGDTGGIGLRCSSDSCAAALLDAFGGPITATSANRSGEPAASDVATARASFGPVVDAYVDDGPRRSSSASTVVELSSGRFYLRRAGAIAASAIAQTVDLPDLED